MARQIARRSLFMYSQLELIPCPSSHKPRYMMGLGTASREQIPRDGVLIAQLWHQLARLSQQVLVLLTVGITPDITNTW